MLTPFFSSSTYLHQLLLNTLYIYTYTGGSIRFAKPSTQVSSPSHNPHIEHAWLFRSGFKSIFSPPFVLIFFFKDDRSVSASSTLKNKNSKRGGKGMEEEKANGSYIHRALAASHFWGKRLLEFFFTFPETMLRMVSLLYAENGTDFSSRSS